MLLILNVICRDVCTLLFKQTVGVRLRAVRLVVFLLALFTARAPAFFLGPTSHLVPFLVIPFVDGGMLWVSGNSLVLAKKYFNRLGHSFHSVPAETGRENLFLYTIDFSTNRQGPSISCFCAGVFDSRGAGSVAAAKWLWRLLPMILVLATIRPWVTLAVCFRIEEWAAGKLLRG
jgi:hypothetical protein